MDTCVYSYRGMEREINGGGGREEMQDEQRERNRDYFWDVMVVNDAMTVVAMKPEI